MKLSDLTNFLNLAFFNNMKLWKIDKFSKSIFNCVKNRYSLKNLSELFYLLENKNNLVNLHIFCKCGNKNKFINRNKGYCNYCSSKCSNSDPLKKKVTENNNLKKYGVKHTFQSENNKLKTEKTNLERYGKKHYTNPLKARNTRLNDIDKDGLNSYQRAAIKGAQTGKINIDINGNNSFKRGSIKAKNTKEIRYGDKNYNNYEKHRKTCVKRYNNAGYTNRNKARNTMLNDIDSKGLNCYQRAYKKAQETKIFKYNNKNYNNRDKAENTCLIKYNNKTFLGSKKHLELYKDPKFVSMIQELKYKTKKKNNSFHTSSPENNCYNKILTKFADAIHHYTADFRYPFECDIYIPSQDLFIECHFSQYHQYKPFDINNKQDWIKLLCLELNATRINKSCNNRKNQYEQMIYNWTDLDVRKLEAFKKNNLNYKIFYTEKEFMNWLEEYNAL